MNEMPALSEMYEELKDNPDFKFISFTFEPEEKIEKVRKKFNLQFDIYSIPQSECERLSRSVFYPVNIILDRDRRIRYYATGGPDDEKEGFENISNKITPRILGLLQ